MASVRLVDVIDVLEAAYPPRLAQSWDSVGLVCGDPGEPVESVTVAVDATAAVVAQVPDGGLLLDLACREVRGMGLDLDIHVNIGAARLGNPGFEQQVREVLTR
ncbi:Nif3-like dinuclear metal center hexameric protein, partial [Mycobacterium sp. NAZ190054]|uniref:Nif3-like dinuclear metal center hexameric protein n=1 Tax=Mycobacterium sp. NAZ190054 TaxID=1747766 RepID=UPI000793518C